MLNIETEISEYITWLKQKRNVSENTRREYERRVGKFFEWLGDAPITEASVLNYLSSLGQAGMSDKTINCYRDAISAYMKFRNLNFEKPPIRKLVEKIPDIIEDDKLFKEVIIEKAEDIFKRKPEKAVALLYLFYDTGLRPSSVVSLKRENFFLEKNMGICLNVKSKKQQFFYFTREARIAFEVYFDIEEEEKNAFNISRSGISRLFRVLKKYERLKGIKLRPTLFRHNIASILANAGFTEKELQEFLGHSSPISTKPYVKLNTDRVKNKYIDIRNKK